MTDPEIDDLLTFIGNVVRLAAAIELTEARGACAAAESNPMDVLILEPLLPATTKLDNITNQQLLNAFCAFRREIESIRAMKAGMIVHA